MDCWDLLEAASWCLIITGLRRKTLQLHQQFHNYFRSLDYVMAYEMKIARLTNLLQAILDALIFEHGKGKNFF